MMVERLLAVALMSTALWLVASHAAVPVKAQFGGCVVMLAAMLAPQTPEAQLTAQARSVLARSNGAAKSGGVAKSGGAAAGGHDRGERLVVDARHRRVGDGGVPDRDPPGSQRHRRVAIVERCAHSIEKAAPADRDRRRRADVDDVRLNGFDLQQRLGV